jgi:uncharacterized membrane protein YoaK (UPF0700 family)
MFRHQGKNRSLLDNLRIATVLSFVAGLVNVTGFLAFKQLTTNVTGHFALFITDINSFEFWKGTIYFLYLLAFLVGSFTSGFLIEKFKENKRLNVFVVPTFIETLILLTIGIISTDIVMNYPNVIICALLFAMGLQNAFVTKISNAVVRTTHLTGLFTDLGIDLSLLLFAQQYAKIQKLKANITLRLYIIFSFFAGGVAAGILYSALNFKLHTLVFGALILLASLLYDDFRFQIIKARRRYKQRNLV